MAEFTLAIDGMHCGACVRRVSQALEATPGVKVNEVRVGAARLSSNEEQSASVPASVPSSVPSSVPASVNDAIASLAKAGYTAHLEA